MTSGGPARTAARRNGSLESDELAPGNRCISVDHRTRIADSTMRAPSQVGVTYISTGSAKSIVVRTGIQDYRLNDRGTRRIRTDHAGVGLGLVIAKSITQAHDGTLALASRATGGLRITVHLPAAPPRTDS